MQVKIQLRRAAALLLWLAGLAGVAQAVEFNETEKAPRALAGAELKTRAESYTASFAKLSDASPLEMVSSKAIALEHFELEWQLDRALEDKRPLEDLSALGLVRHGDGFSIDYSAFPQWQPFYEILASFVPTMNMVDVGPMLVARGFRESDVAAIQGYVETHDLKTETAARTLPMAIGFSKVVKKYDRIKRPAGKDQVFAFLYQRDKAVAETRRAWAEGLLRTLDDQRVRILRSCFSEMKGVGYKSPDDVEAGVASLLAAMRLPDYEQRATAEARGVTP